MDYKNTPEVRTVQSKYGKILHASRPEPPHNHPRMPMSNRAKIFSPFAALRGYEDEIASEGRDHLKGNRIELSEEGKQALNQKISQLRKGQEITIKYFMDGYYEDIVGILDAVDTINKELRIYTGFINDTGKELPTIIAFEDDLNYYFCDACRYCFSAEKLPDRCPDCGAVAHDNKKAVRPASKTEIEELLKMQKEDKEDTQNEST